MQSFEDIVKPDELLSLLDRNSDPGDEYNKMQILASLRLIRFFFGREWYKLVLGKIEGAEIYSKPLGLALKIFGTQLTGTNFEEKIADLRSRSFTKAFFELETALTYALNDFNVKFLTTRSEFKTPDLVISKAEITAAVECKKRDQQSSATLEVRVRGVVDRLHEAFSQIRATNLPGIVWIGVEDNLSESSQERIAYCNAISGELWEMAQVSCVMLTSDLVREDEMAYFRSKQITGIPNKACVSQIPQFFWCNPNLLAHPIPEVFSYPDAPPILPSSRK